MPYIGISSDTGGGSTTGMVRKTAPDERGVSSGTYYVDADSGGGGEGDCVDSAESHGYLLVGDKVMGDDVQETHHRDTVDDHNGGDPGHAQSSVPEDTSPRVERRDETLSSALRDRNVSFKLVGDYSRSSVESFSSSVFVETGHESE